MWGRAARCKVHSGVMVCRQPAKWQELLIHMRLLPLVNATAGGGVRLRSF